MNERIKELIEQCTEDYPIKPRGSWFNKEKFAELIVKECIEIVEPCRCGCICKTDVAITDSIIADIKEHFGVEE